MNLELSLPENAHEISYHAVKWTAVPVLSNNYKYVYNEKYGLLFSFSKHNNILVGKLIMKFTGFEIAPFSVIELGQSFNIEVDYWPSITSEDDFIYIGVICIVNILTLTVSDGISSNLCYSLDSPKIFHYSAQKQIFYIYQNGAEIVAECYVEDSSVLFININCKTHRIAMDYSIYHIDVVGTMLYIICECGDYHDDLYSVTAIVNWITGAVEYICLVANRIIPAGVDYFIVDISTYSKYNDDYADNVVCKKIVHVPNYYSILKKVNLADEFSKLSC
jgi:hypothetical protein